MRLNLNSLLCRTIFILALGVIGIGIDIYLAFLLIIDDSPSTLDWIILVTIIIGGFFAVAYFVSSQLIKPLRKLSTSTKKFGINFDSPSIPETGPNEFREAARNFNLMQKRIRQFVNERMQLLAAISHDFRSPLTRLQLHLESIDNLDTKKKMLNEIEELSSMIQSTLTFIKGDAVNEPLQKTDLVTLIQSLCDDISDLHGPAHFTGPAHFAIACKPLAIKRALGNIIENAVKYGHQAEVCLTPGESTVAISVKDSGAGISKNEMENVFIPFYRIEKSRNRNTGGVGLGLSVAQTLIQSHGGKINLENLDRPSGLRVTVILPFG